MSTIPTTLTHTVKNFPVKKAAALFVDSTGRVTSDFMWRLQQGVADCKFKILQLMHEEDMVPVGPAEFEWDITVRGRMVMRTIDGEATEGKWITLPVDVHQLNVAKYERAWDVSYEG